MREPASDGQRTARQAPDEDPLEVSLQVLAAQSPHGEGAASDLRGGIGGSDPQSPGAEGLGNGCRHDQADQHETDEHEPHGYAVRVEPVGHPRRVGPDEPDHGQQETGLERTVDGRTREEVVRQLGDGEDVHQVEEELDVGDALRPSAGS